MRTFITIDKAIEEIAWLERYIELAENYQANDKGICFFRKHPKGSRANEQKKDQTP